MGKVSKTIDKKKPTAEKNLLKMKTKPAIMKKSAKPKPALKAITKSPQAKGSPKQKLVKKAIAEKPDSPDLPKGEKAVLDEELVQSGIKALRDLIKKQSKEKKELFDEEEQILLQITAVKIPKCPARNIHLPLKHSLRTEDSEICMIVADIKENGSDHEKTVKHYEDLLKKKGVTVKIDKIIPFKQLREEHSQHESRRKLIQLYDYFILDGRIHGYAIRMLREQLKRQRKSLLNIKFEMTKLNDFIQRALCKVDFTIHSKGTSFVVNLAHIKMTDKQILENVSSAFDALEENFPGGTANIRSLLIKTCGSLAVPVYVTLKKNSAVNVPVVKARKPKAHRAVKGELSTRNNSDVVVFPDGEIKVQKIDNNKKKPTKKTTKVANKKKLQVIKKAIKEDLLEMNNSIMESEDKKVLVKPVNSKVNKKQTGVKQGNAANSKLKANKKAQFKKEKSTLKNSTINKTKQNTKKGKGK